MAQLLDLMAYLLENYPYPEELSNARLTKLIFLCDWKSSLDHGHQMTAVKWYYDNYGPFVPDILNTARNNSEIFSVEATTNYYGTTKSLIKLSSLIFSPSLTPEEKAIADKVIGKTRGRTFSDFIRLVYSTYPVMKSERFSNLDLPRLAKEYKESVVR